jgi:hypothetical protein
MTKPWRISIAVVITLGAAAVLARPQEADDPLDSLKVCAATQKLIFENQFVRVIDDQIPPGVTEPMHRHRHSVSVYLNTNVNEQVTQDGKKSRQERKAGTANWAEPVVHSVTNIDSVPSHAIRIELKY